MNAKNTGIIAFLLWLFWPRSGTSGVNVDYGNGSINTGLTYLGPGTYGMTRYLNRIPESVSVYIDQLYVFNSYIASGYTAASFDADSGGSLNLVYSDQPGFPVIDPITGKWTWVRGPGDPEQI